jgi:hypothetical protein
LRKNDSNWTEIQEHTIDDPSVAVWPETCILYQSGGFETGILEEFELILGRFRAATSN